MEEVEAQLQVVVQVLAHLHSGSQHRCSRQVEEDTLTDHLELPGPPSLGREADNTLGLSSWDLRVFG